MITYKDIYDAAKRERYSETLQPIPKNFVKEVAQYLKEKREAASKDNDVFSDVLLKTKKQLENAITLFQELLRRRRRKIMNLVLIASETGISKQDFNNMLLIEKKLFERFVADIEKSDKELSSFLNGSAQEKEIENDMIVFLEDVGDFVGMDGKSLGPFSQGEVSNIPREVAKILVEDGKAEFL
ncbi:MAG: DNA replication complex GINS family protein [Nanoarchaeota archaeon]|nr:DNA replication complex GINS family protein [Nanoarchaeota archaeon]